MIATLPLAFSVLLSAKTVAVVDLSSPKSPAVAEAFRKLPPLRANMLSAKGTNAAVSDAEGFNVICTVDDGPCLEKLMYMIHVDELVAFAVSGGAGSAAGATVAVVDVTGTGKSRRATVKPEGSAQATAQAAWAALDAASPPTTTTTTTPTTTTTTTTPTVIPPSVGAGPPKETGTGSPGMTPVAENAKAGQDNGISPAVPVAIAGGAVGVLCGAFTAFLYADLVRQAKAAEDGTAPLQDSFYSTSGIAIALAGASVVGLATGVVGTVLAFSGGGDAGSSE